MIRAVGAALIALTFLGCQNVPTRVSERQTRPFEAVVDKSHRPIAMTDATVILDVRSAFDFGLNHIENSLRLRWEDLSDHPATGDVTQDLHRAATRLGLAGLTPKTPTLIVSPGGDARIEAGRLAWTLLYLGFEDVQTASLTTLKKYATQKVSAPPQNAPSWEAGKRRELQVLPEEFAAMALDPRTRLERKIWILDVRSEAEYLGKSAPAVPNIGTMNMPWSEFYDAEGRPSRKINKRLKDLGINQTDRVWLISQKGVRSGAATYALIASGFTQAHNVLEGWRGYGKKE